MDPRLLAALAEPSRLRIVELLGTAPRSVGQIAAELGLRQPQATKHLQTLQRAGLVTVHPLGQRRIYALEREPLRALGRWAEGLAADHPSEAVLEQYARAIAAERARPPEDAARTIAVERELPAPAAEVFRAWTTPEAVARWWSPEHFAVSDCTVEPVPGGRLEIEMQEGDGTRHRATGRFGALDPPRALTFDLAPLGPRGAPLFQATHEVRLAERGGATHLTMAIHLSDVRPEAVPALAGMEIGWGQTLDKLAAELRRGIGSPRP